MGRFTRVRNRLPDGSASRRNRRRVTGIHLNIEQVQPATLAAPDAADSGDYRSARLLRDAVRLGFAPVPDHFVLSAVSRASPGLIS